jgi:hypothetical protein
MGKCSFWHLLFFGKLTLMSHSHCKIVFKIFLLFYIVPKKKSIVKKILLLVIAIAKVPDHNADGIFLGIYIF